MKHFVLEKILGNGKKMTKFDHWKNVCKIHWREIVTMSIALHWIVDLLILGPIVFFLGVMFGIHIDGGHHG